MTSKNDWLAIALFTYGVLAFTMGLLPLLIAFGSGGLAAFAGYEATQGDPDAGAAALFLGLYAGVFGVFAVITMIFGLLGVVFAWGVRGRRPWARIGGVVFSFLAGMMSMGACFPIGMLLGILLIVAAVLVMVDPDAAKEYEAGAVGT